jgi:hypothetical protein
MTETCHVPLDKRGTARTCYFVADTFGIANCETVAPPALGDTQQGNAAARGGTVAAQSSQAFRRQSAKAAAWAKTKIIAKPPPPPPVDDSLDHTLAVTTETAKEAFAKAVEWHVTGRFTHVSISDDIKTYSIDAFFIGNGAPGDCEGGRGHCRAGAEGEGEIEG